MPRTFDDTEIMAEADTAQSLTDRAYQRLRAEILHGDLAPGERLQVAQLQGRYNLGLTPIREALMRLSSEGLVEAESRRGSRVMPISLAELADLTTTRCDIERLCLTQAMTHGDATWEALVVAAMHLLSRTPLPTSPDDRAAAERWETQHRNFHAALVSACPSAWLRRFWSNLADHSERYRKIRLLNRGKVEALVRDVTAEHFAIMHAVIGRDAQQAISLMDEHLHAAARGVAALLHLSHPPLENTEDDHSNRRARRQRG
jgi:DNA-binding GntR family transcriptional regulator